jgi:hypothetical protein
VQVPLEQTAAGARQATNAGSGQLAQSAAATVESSAPMYSADVVATAVPQIVLHRLYSVTKVQSASVLQPTDLYCWSKFARETA